MAGIDNLVPIRSTEEAREKGRQGGYKSGKARREKRKLKNILGTLLAMEPTADIKEKIDLI